jgi:hypothetical protein
MPAEVQSTFLRVTPAPQRSDVKVSRLHFLALTLFLPMIIVIGDCILGIVTPITDGAEDDISRLDGVWRLVQGQHLGIDFHDPLGFGFFQVSAMFWHLLGPHHYVLWVSAALATIPLRKQNRCFVNGIGAAALFALVIVSCGCVVAIRQLRHATGLATLFCITLAFVASGPAYREYFDDYTHVSVFSHVSLADFLRVNGFDLLEIRPRFLPLTVKSRLPVLPWLIKAYLASPIKPMAKQMLIRAGVSYN